MRKEFNFLVALLFISLSSCNDEPPFIPENKELISKSENRMELRGLSYDKPSVTNPTLHADWENVTKIVLNNGLTTDAPWTNNGGNSIDVPLNYRMDIKKEDGWYMLSHSMLEKNSAEPNYILLYNRNTGILKGFYYNGNPNPNQLMIWALESAQPTSILQSNSLVTGILNSKSNFITTSNLLTKNVFSVSQNGTPNSFGPLSSGWNAFSFELPYGEIDKAPIVSIYGYSQIKSEISGEGSYSGEVVIPVSKEESGLDNILSPIKKVLGAGSQIIPQIKTIEKAVGIAGTILGQTSLSKSKTSVTNIRATSSGKVNLTGTSTTYLGGIVSSCNEIDLRKLNGNTDLGLWNFSTEPTFKYDNYVPIIPCSPLCDNTATVVMRSDLLLSQIKINPAIKNNIKKYSIINKQFFFQNSSSGRFLTEKASSNCYLTDFRFKSACPPTPPPFDPNNPRMYAYYQTVPNIPPNVFINVTVKFEFHDGSSFISSRNFKAGFIQVDIRDQLLAMDDKKNGRFIILM